MNFVLQRNYVLTTRNGRSIEFKKDVPTYVPPICIKEAVAIGAVPEDGSDTGILDEPVFPTAPATFSEREEKINKVIDRLIQENDRENFTAAGMPKLTTLSERLGWRVEKKEVAAIWNDRFAKALDVKLNGGE